MSEQHTPTPWSPEVDDSEPFCFGVIDGDNRRFVGFARREEDRRRIVACVNACAGIPTDQLESVSGKLAISSSVSMWQSYCDKKMQLEDAIEQRDELLAAIGVAQATMNCAGIDTPGIVARTVEKYADAIASVKGSYKVVGYQYVKGI